MGDTNVDVDEDTRRLLASHAEYDEQLGNQDSGSHVQKPDKPYPAYFFPQLSQQRAVYCLDVLKREDIRSVCELGCGEGSVIRLMTNGASHSDSFPEPYFEDPVVYDIDSDAPTSRGHQRSGSDAEEQDVSDADSDSGPSTSKSSIGGEKGINDEVLEKYKSLPTIRVQDKELHLRRIAGLDVLEHSLANAIEATAPPSVESSPFASYYSFNMGERERWEDLRVEIWQGSLDVYNDAFDNFEAFIMTEVIEHLYDRTLEKFPEILFGSYRPRIVVITTPNYDFNKYFDLGKRGQNGGRDTDGDEKAEEETKSSFLDPTGRTDRRFRDDDHKFEWTQQEFKDWCDTITSTYDYSVEISGVGSLRNYFGKGGFHLVEEQEEKASKLSGDEQPLDESTPPSARASTALPPHIQEALSSVPDPSKFFATQTAVFRRRFAYESERSPRSPMQVPLAFYGVKPARQSSTDKAKTEASTGMAASASDSGSMSLQTQHKLLKTHYYKASKDAGNPKSLAEIRAVLDDMMRERMRIRACSLRELWGRNEVAKACGGYINKIIEAIVQDSSKAWALEYRPSVLERGGQMEDAVYLILQDFVEPEADWGEDAELLDDGDEEMQGVSNGVKSLWAGGDDLSDDEDGDTAASTKPVENEDPDKPRKTKKQKKKERLEQLQKEEEDRKAQEALNPPEPVWQATEGDDTWAEWEHNTAKGSLMTDEELQAQNTEVASSGWD